MAVVFHLALAATILWPDWLSPTERGLLWAALGVAWLTGLAWSYRLIRRASPKENRRLGEDRFPQAIHAYLQGNLAHAESLARAILRDSPRDVEAALLLATIWRRRGRLDASEKLLRNLARLEMAQPWLWEIERELLRVTQSREDQSTESLPTTEDENRLSGEPAARESPPNSPVVHSSNAAGIPHESRPASKAA